jgi:hypothetical protein
MGEMPVTEIGNDKGKDDLCKLGRNKGFHTIGFRERNTDDID